MTKCAAIGCVACTFYSGYAPLAAAAAKAGSLKALGAKGALDAFCTTGTFTTAAGETATPWIQGGSCAGALCGAFSGGVLGSKYLLGLVTDPENFTELNQMAQLHDRCRHEDGTVKPEGSQCDYSGNGFTFDKTGGKVFDGVCMPLAGIPGLKGTHCRPKSSGNWLKNLVVNPDLMGGDVKKRDELVKREKDETISRVAQIEQQKQAEARPANIIATGAASALNKREEAPEEAPVLLPVGGHRNGQWKYAGAGVGRRENPNATTLDDVYGADLMREMHSEMHQHDN